MSKRTEFIWALVIAPAIGLLLVNGWKSVRLVARERALLTRLNGIDPGEGDRVVVSAMSQAELPLAVDAESYWARQFSVFVPVGYGLEVHTAYDRLPSDGMRRDGSYGMTFAGSSPTGRVVDFSVVLIRERGRMKASVRHEGGGNTTILQGMTPDPERWTITGVAAGADRPDVGEPILLLKIIDTGVDRRRASESGLTALHPGMQIVIGDRSSRSDLEKSLELVDDP